MNHGPFLPWHALPPSATPHAILTVPTPKLDILTAHDDRVQRGNLVASFCGSPIITLDELGIEVDEERELTRRLDASSHTSLPAEILPGEGLCDDGIVRRTTTLEAQGDAYYNRVAIEAGNKRVNITDARQASRDGQMVYYRPDRVVGEGEYALVVQEEACEYEGSPRTNAS